MASSTFEQIGVLGLFTETPLHCGAEAGVGYVDLPVQRERHTGYPVIPGSTLKGRLKDDAGSRLADELRRAVFGTMEREVSGNDDPPAAGTDSDRQGSLRTVPGGVSFGDGILAALPVRSTAAPFFWVSCPLALERVLRLLGTGGHDLSGLGQGAAWGAEAGPVVLEETALERTVKPGLLASDGVVARLLDLLPAASVGFEYTRSIFLERFLVVSDDVFSELAETCTDVVTRIKLNALGTTTTLKPEDYPELDAVDRQGNLFVEEVVPPQTLFAAPVRSSRELAGDLVAALPGVTQLGGDETIGRGLTYLTLARPTEARHGRS